MLNPDKNPVEVRVNNLTFSYPDTPHKVALEKINLDIKAGTLVALIGSSGSGKTTLASVILGFLQAQDSKVYIDGQTPQDFVFKNPGDVSYVPQSLNLISGTVAENIALGVEAENLDIDSLVSAAELAQLLPWVNSLNSGFDTELESNSLSGGQLQRIGLARAMYTKPRLLVLDEPTSSLDAETESLISKALDRLRGKITQIVIAHRLTTVENADNVYLLEGGKIIASGPFAELRKNSPIVARQVEHLTFKQE